MDNNVIEKTTKYAEKQIPDSVINTAKQFGHKAATITSDYAGKAAEYTEKNVKKYPLAAVGIALGSGVVLGTLGTLLFRPRHPSVYERVATAASEMEFGKQALKLGRKLISKYF